MDDRELTVALATLGLAREHWRALVLLPLIEVAWADGRIQKAERRLIAEIAVEHGIDPGAAFFDRWLSKRPPKATFFAARALLLRLWNRAGPRQAPQPATVDELMSLCEEVAEAAGGLFGLAFTVERSERECMAEIAASLSLGPELPSRLTAEWRLRPAGTPKPAPRAEEESTVPLLDLPEVDHEAPTMRLVLPKRRQPRTVDPRTDETTDRIRPPTPPKPGLSGVISPGAWGEDDVTSPYLDPAGHAGDTAAFADDDGT